MATKLNVSENQEKIPLKVSTKGGLRTITPDDGSPYYVGARAYVTQNVDGATVTVIDKEGTTTANIYNGQTGATGADGADGFSPIATVSKVGDTATITITDKNGTTTAEVYDGSAGGASAFVAEFNVTTYADVKDAYDDDAIIICTADDSGNTMVLQLVYFDATNEIFTFAEPNGDGVYWTELSNANGWDDGTRYLASTDVATQLRDGLMNALDKQKLDNIASGAEVNVQSDWNQSTNTADDYIKNKPTKLSQFNNDSGFTSTSVTQVVSTGTKIATVTIDGTGTDLYAPSGGGGTITDVEVDGTSVVTGGVAEIDLTGKSDVGHTHTTSAITDFPTTVSSFTNDAGYITGYTETDPIFVASAAHGISSSDISNWNGKSDFSGSYNDLTDKPTIPTVNNATLTIQKNGSTVKTFTANASSNVTANITVPTKTSDLSNDSGFITGYTETDPVFSASAASGITSSNISTWNGKYAKPSGGIPKTDLASAVQTSLGLADTALQSFTETDPVFSASAAYGIASGDITSWNGKSTVSVNRKVSSGTNIADITIDGTTTQLYAPTGGGGGSVTDVQQNGVSVMNGTVAEVSATLVQIVRW